jgi:hypothetical protein
VPHREDSGAPTGALAWLPLLDELARHRQKGDTRAIVATVDRMAALSSTTSQPERAVQYGEEAVSLCRAAGDRPALGAALHRLAHLAYTQDEMARARALREEALALYWEIDDTHGIAASLWGLANVARRQHDQEKAVALYEESVMHYRRLGEKYGLGATLWALAHTIGVEADGRRYSALTAESLRVRGIGVADDAPWPTKRPARQRVDSFDFDIGLALNDETDEQRAATMATVTAAGRARGPFARAAVPAWLQRLAEIVRGRR